MVIKIWLSRFCAGRPERTRLGKFRQVLLSALETDGYAGALRSAGLGTPEAIGALRSMEEGLARLPWTRFPVWHEDPQRFENRRGRGEAEAGFSYPFQPTPSIVFFDGTGMLPQLTEQETLAANARVLCEYARRIVEHQVVRPHLMHAVLCFAGADEGYLTPQDRDLLWHGLQAPVFEQFLDADCQVMAGECEAHEGLHVDPESGVFEVRDGELFLTSLAARRHPALRLGTGLHAEIDTAVCVCGRSGPRLRDLRRMDVASLACAAD